MHFVFLWDVWAVNGTTVPAHLIVLVSVLVKLFAPSLNAASNPPNPEASSFEIAQSEQRSSKALRAIELRHPLRP